MQPTFTWKRYQKYPLKGKFRGGSQSGSQYCLDDVREGFQLDRGFYQTPYCRHISRTGGLPHPEYSMIYRKRVVDEVGPVAMK